MATADRQQFDDQVEQLVAVPLHVELAGVLGDLVDLLPLLERLTTARPRGRGFLTFKGRQSLDRQTREERLIARENAQKGFPAPSGNKPAPGNLTSVSTDVDLTFRLVDAGHRLVQALLRQGDLCPVVRLGPEATNRERLTYLLDLHTLVRDVPTLTRVTTDLTEMRDQVREVVDGETSVALRELYGPIAACPHCKRPTLIMYPGDDLIVCEQDTRTGEKHPPCTCSDPMCGCKSQPRAYRHKWYRNPLDERRRTPSDDWRHLAAQFRGRTDAGAPAKPKKKTQPVEEPPS